MKRIIVFLAAFAVAVPLLALSSGGARPAQAAPAHIVLLNAGLCLAAASPPPAPCLNSIGFEYATGDGDKGIAEVAARIGGRDTFANLWTGTGTIQPSDFASLATFTGGQVHQLDGGVPLGLSRLAVIAFVDNYAPVTFRTTAGFFAETGGPAYTCRTTDSANPDPDCGSSPATLVRPNAPDGVVVAYLACTLATCPTLGAAHLTVEQDGIVYPVDFTVVGEPRSVTWLTLEKGIQAGVPNGALGAPDCPFAGNLPFIQKALGEAEKTVIVARALDAQNTAIVGAWFNFTSSDTTRAVVALPVAPTLNLGGFGFGAPNIVCAPAGATAGSVTITATLTTTTQKVLVDPLADPGHGPTQPIAFGTTTFNVVDKPAGVTLTADPPSLNCDGQATSTVSAKVVTADGSPSLGGVAVNFSVQTSGTADPISAMTNDKGIATSVIAPLAGTASGVPVVVSTSIGGVPQPALDRSILVQCAGGPTAATAGSVAAGAGAPSPASSGIRGPDTGSGSGNTPGPLSWWPALALAAAALMLAGVRLAKNRD